MVKQKKTPGRPKKEFVSKKPKTKIKAWPGRPRKEFVSKKPKTKIKAWPGRSRKDKKDRIAHVKKVSPEITSFVAKSVDDTKKKDLIILILFLLSFVLFVVSLYYTFMRDKTPNQEELAQITNVETGNINYNIATTIEEPEVKISIENTQTQETLTPTVQTLTEEQKIIVDFYQAINAVDMDVIYKLTDARLEESNVFKTYYSRRWLTNFSEALVAPKIVLTNIQEVDTTSTNPNIKSFAYTLEYMIASNQQKFTEERSTTLIKKGDARKVGKIMCETKWCSTMPFFNTEKYK